MGKNASKFYKDKTNDQCRAVTVNPNFTVDLAYYDESFADIVAKAMAPWFTVDEIDRSKNSHLRFVFKYSAGEKHAHTDEAMQQHVVVSIAAALASIGWRYVATTKVGEQNVFLYAKDDDEEQNLGDVLKIKTFGNNELFVSAEKEDMLAHFRSVMGSLSSSKGVQSIDQYEDEARESSDDVISVIHSAKLTLRHKPWSIDDFDWWGGAYLTSKMIQRLNEAVGGFLFSVDLSARKSKLGGARDIQVSLVGFCEDRVKFRRVSDKAITKFTQSLFDMSENLVDQDFDQEKMGYTVKFQGSNPWHDQGPDIVSHVFNAMNETGYAYIGSFRAEHSGRSSLIFARKDPYDSGRPFFKRDSIVAIHLSGKNGLHFSQSLSGVEVAEVTGSLGLKWYKGPAKGQGSHKMALNGAPWSDPVYGPALLCDLVQIMNNSGGYEMVGSVDAGSGEVMVFGVREE